MEKYEHIGFKSFRSQFLAVVSLGIATMSTAHADIGRFLDDIKNTSNDVSYLQINGLSYHDTENRYFYDMNSGKRRPFNEVNLGAGIEYFATDHFGVMAGYYNNSYYDDSFYIGAIVETSSLFNQEVVGVGIQAGFVSGYNNHVPKQYLLADIFAPAVLPYLRIGNRDDIQLKMGVTYIPSANLESEDTTLYTAQLRVPFKAVSGNVQKISNHLGNTTRRFLHAFSH